MTREEREKAIDLLDNLRGMIEDNQGNDYDFALKKGIEALAQEPCEDAISRADAKKYLSAPDANGDRVIYESDLDLLPPVQPKQKVGHWDDISIYKDLAWYCSECEHFTTMKHNYCPKCGARMIEPQESEDK